MKLSLEHTQNNRGATEVRHVVISLALVVCSLAAGMWLRGESRSSDSSVNLPFASSTADPVRGQFAVEVPSSESKFVSSKNPVVMTPEIKKFGDSCKILKDALSSAMPDVPLAKAALKDMSLRFEEDPVAQGTFLHQVRTLPASAIPTMLSVMDLPIDAKIRAILLHKMFTIQMPHVNSALNEWLTITKDLSLLEEGLLAIQFVPEKDTFFKALTTLVSENRTEGIKLTPALRWLAADAIFDTGHSESKAALTAMAVGDSDEKIRAHAADLVKALTPSENGVMVLGNKKWASNESAQSFLQPGDMLISCDNVSCDFAAQVKSDLKKKNPESRVTLIFKRGGETHRLENTAEAFLNQLSNFKLYTARVHTNLPVEKSGDGF
jgi:hypothetical protein